MAEAKPQMPRRDTRYRMAANVGFNARVEPLRYSHERVARDQGFFARWRGKRRIDKLVAAIRAALKRDGVEAGDWDKSDGGCVCNLRVAKMGLVGGFQRHLLAELAPEARAGILHIDGLKDTNSLVIPVDFPKPFVAEGVAVASTPRIQAELKIVNEVLRIEDTFAIKKMASVDFLDASEKDIAVYESRFGSRPDFWPQMAYVLIKKLADMSAEHKMPVHFA